MLRYYQLHTLLRSNFNTTIKSTSRSCVWNLAKRFVHMNDDHYDPMTGYNNGLMYKFSHPVDVKSLFTPSDPNINQILFTKIHHKHKEEQLEAYVNKALQYLDNYQKSISLLKLLEAFGKREFATDFSNHNIFIDIVIRELSNYDGKLPKRGLILRSMKGLRICDLKKPSSFVLIELLTNLFKKGAGDIHVIPLSMALYGLQHLDGTDIQTRKLLTQLERATRSCEDPFDSLAIGNSLYGLRRIVRSNELLGLISALTEKIKSTDIVFDGDVSIANSLYGMQRMSCNDKEVAELLSAVTDKIKGAQVTFNSHCFSNSLYGLRSMTNDAPEVREVLKALAVKFEKSKAQMTSNCIANALNGMKRMTSDSEEVLLIVDILSKRIRASNAILTTSDIRDSLLGMTGMKCEVQVLNLLIALKEKIKHVDKLNSKAIGGLQGLRNMTSDHSEVLEFLAVMEKKINQLNIKMSCTDAGYAMLGFQNMTSDAKEVRSVLLALFDKFSLIDADFSGIHVFNMLCGMQKMSCEHKEVRMLLMFVTKKTESSKGTFDAYAISKALHSLYRKRNGSEVEELLSALFAKLKTLDCALSPQETALALFGLQLMDTKSAVVHNLFTYLIKMIYPFVTSLDAISLSYVVHSLKYKGNSVEVEDFMRTLFTAIETVEASKFTESDLNCLVEALKDFIAVTPTLSDQMKSNLIRLYDNFAKAK